MLLKCFNSLSLLCPGCQIFVCLFLIIYYNTFTESLYLVDVRNYFAAIYENEVDSAAVFVEVHSVYHFLEAVDELEKLCGEMVEQPAEEAAADDLTSEQTVSQKEAPHGCCGAPRSNRLEIHMALI